jgi:hypothetical protein
MGWFFDIGEFLRDMFRHWVGIVSGLFSIFLACFQLGAPSFFAGDRGLLHSRMTFAALCLFAFFLACLSAWREKKAALNKANEDLDAAIDTNRPEVTAIFELATVSTYMNGGPQVQILNRGSGDAWQVQIEPIVLADRKVEFICPSILPKDKPREARCLISAVEPNAANNLERILYQQAIIQCREDIYEGVGDPQPKSFTVKFPLRTSWKDSRGNPFHSEGEVTYHYKKPLRTAKTEFPAGIKRGLISDRQNL